MRLIRYASRPVSNSLSHQLRSRQVLEASNQSINPEMFRVQYGRNTWWRGRSSVAAVPSDSYQGKNERRKVPKHERKSLVENYVNKYRSLQGGKFPTYSETKKNVGGSYYIIKSIVDELKYNCKNSSSDEMASLSVEKDAVKTGEVEIGRVSQSEETEEFINHVEHELSTQSTEGKAEVAFSVQIDVDMPISQTRTSESVSVNLQSEEALKSAFSVPEDEVRLPVNHKPEDIKLTDETKHSLHSDPEINIKQVNPPEDKVKFSEQPKAEQQQSTDTRERDADKEHTENVPEKISSAWQNLKTFASGFFGKWR